MLDLPALEIQLPDNLRNATVQDERAPLATGYTAFLPNLDEFGAYCSKNPAQIRSNISVLAPRRRQPQRRRQAPAGLILACLRVIDRVAWRCAWWWCLGAGNGGLQFASLNGAAQLCALQWDGRGEASGKSGGPGRTSKPYMPLSTPKAEAVCRFNNLHTQKESEMDDRRMEEVVSVGVHRRSGEAETRASAAASSLLIQGKGKPPPTSGDGVRTIIATIGF